MAESIGLYGGSFDPIHHGHLIVARAVAERIGLARIIFLPSARPPHKPAEDLAEPAHRAEMVKRAIAGEPVFDFSDFDLARRGPSYTIDTISYYRTEFGPDLELCWIIGADSLAELSTWYRAAALVDGCRIITAVRPGRTDLEWTALRASLSEEQIAKLRAGVVPTPMIEISSTDIRRRVHAGKSIRYLVPDPVRAYIETHRVYRDTPPQV